MTVPIFVSVAPRPTSPATTPAGLEISDLVAESWRGTLADARVDAEEIETIHVGNAFGELFTGQAQLGAMPATVEPALWGVPAARHEAACASGSVAILAAMAEIEAGRYDCALVLGVEQERNVPGDQAARHLGAAAWVGHEGEDATYLWPHMFCRSRTSTTAATASTTATCRRSPRRTSATRSTTRTRRPGLDAHARELRRRRRGEPGRRGPPAPLRLRQVTDGAAGSCSRPPTAEAWARRTAVARDCRGSSAGATAPPACRSTRSSRARPTTPTCCRTCAAADHRRVRPRRHRRRRRARRHRDPRLLHADGVPRDRPLRHHRPRRGLAGDRGRRLERDGALADQPERRADRRRSPRRRHRRAHGARRLPPGDRRAGDNQVDGRRRSRRSTSAARTTTTVSFVVGV